MFHLFNKLPPELQDCIWEFALPSEIINSDEERPGRHSVSAMASVCRRARQAVLRYGLWLTTPQSSMAMFFIPDRSVLYCGEELTVTANQVFSGFDATLMRMAVSFKALRRLKEIIVLISDGDRRIPLAWREISEGRALGQVEIHKSEGACGTSDGRLVQPRMHDEKHYHPRAEWTSERWEEVKTATKRGWLLALWYAQDPIHVGKQAILDPSQWSKFYWIEKELYHMPKLTAAYIRKSL
ncbi:hypothetical protein F4803DRAFT_2464 [Xylaria telfairii]|nr:hypothetical protein F4803DRAFT_2464 [Xylaria telfairii]